MELNSIGSGSSSSSSSNSSGSSGSGSRVLGNDSNKSKFDSGGNQEEIEFW
jgi:hypothetical protein